MHIRIFFVLGIGVLVAARNVTVDNTSPLVVFSPAPCFQQATQDCSPEWTLSESADFFNGSATSTTGPDPAHNLNVLPRASLEFQGSSIIFVPGVHSTAQAAIVVDNLTSILVNTSTNAFSGAGLDPNANHTITITFVPSTDPTTLEIDYFIIDQNHVNVTSTSSASTSIFPTQLPNSLPPLTIAPFPTHHPHAPSHKPQLKPSTGVPAGTIAAVTISGFVLILLSVLIWFLTARRRRRRTALVREKNILGDLNLPSRWVPSERAGIPIVPEGAAPKPSSTPWEGSPLAEKGKAPEEAAPRRTWRESKLPPVHYIPWRGRTS